MYCPWDEINYYDELLAAPSAPPQNYWANTSSNDLILRMLKNADQTTKNEVEELLNDGQIIKRMKQELTYRDIGESIERFHQRAGYSSAEEHERELLPWQLLGFLRSRGN